jgi:hypothetical protein
LESLDFSFDVPETWKRKDTTQVIGAGGNGMMLALEDAGLTEPVVGSVGRQVMFQPHFSLRTGLYFSFKIDSICL